MRPHPDPSPRPRRRNRRRLFASVAIAALASSPTLAGAQYGGGAYLTVNPVEVEIDGVFSYFGTQCAGGSTVVITLDGFPDILDTTIAEDDSSYTGFDVGLPDGVIAGTQYTVRATCGPDENFAVITAVCNGGTLPVAGECPDGQTVGGQDPPGTTTTTTTSTTVPGGSGGTGGTTGSDGDGGSGSTTGTNPDLAVTGATFAERAAQIGATLVAAGAFVVLIARRRTDERPAPAPS